MLSLPEQLIAWEDCPWNDPLCVERDVKQLLAQLLTQIELIRIYVMINCYHFMAQVKNWRMLLKQSVTAYMTLLTTSAFWLGRGC